MIRNACLADAAEITDIYNVYITQTSFTFEEQAVDEQEIAQRINQVLTGGLPWLVAIDKEAVVGYAYATKWRQRSAYRYAVEVTVYLKQSARGKGLGVKLYELLFSKLKSHGICTAIAGITLPNAASISLHEKLGMRKVAHFEKVGFKHGKWHDVGYWQISLSGD